MKELSEDQNNVLVEFFEYAYNSSDGNDTSIDVMGRTLRLRVTDQRYAVNTNEWSITIKFWVRQDNKYLPHVMEKFEGNQAAFERDIIYLKMALQG